MAVSAVGFPQARAMILSGEPLSPERAVETGLAYSLLDREAVLEKAVELCGSLARKPTAAYAAAKQSFRSLAGSYARGDDKDDLSDFLARWFSEEAASRRQALLDSLTQPAKE